MRTNRLVRDAIMRSQRRSSTHMPDEKDTTKEWQELYGEIKTKEDEEEYRKWLEKYGSEWYKTTD